MRDFLCERGAGQYTKGCIASQFSTHDLMRKQMGVTLHAFAQPDHSGRHAVGLLIVCGDFAANIAQTGNRGGENEQIVGRVVRR